MALLTKEAEERIISLLLNEGLADSNVVFTIKADAERAGKPVLAELTKRKIISDDMVAHATAAIIGVPYVELKNITIDQDILACHGSSARRKRWHLKRCHARRHQRPNYRLPFQSRQSSNSCLDG